MKRAEKLALANALLIKLKDSGYNALYGDRKGHGFWIEGTVNPKAKSGVAPSWWSFKDASSLVAQ